MTAFLARRILSVVPTLVGISLLTFLILNLIPSDPLLTWSSAGTAPSADELDHLREELRADRGPVARYLDWVVAVMSGDLGRSLRDGRPVTGVIAESLPWTLLLNLTAVLLIYGVAIPFGFLGASSPGSAADRVGGWVLLALYALPSFAAALVLQEVLSVRLHLLPLQGVGDPGISASVVARAIDLLRHLALPAACLALSGWAFVARYARAVFRSALGSEHLVMARAKGLSRLRASLHVLASSAVPLVTLLAAILPGLVGGSVIIEQVFSWPGLGRLYLGSVLARDYPVVLGLTLLSASAVLAGQLVVDVLYLVVDPRTRTGLLPERARA
ncbi:MAG: ABC transporter permease [Acidobacteriota bacterium]